MTTDTASNKTAATTAPAPDTIVFIHGLWMTPKSWDGWIARYEALGYQVIAPAWPGFDQPVEALRADGSGIAGTSIGAVLAHYESVIRALDKPPILIGHSFGGAFVQVLLSRGLGAAGVGLSPAAVKGIPDVPLTTLRSGFGVLGNPLNYGKAVPFTKTQFRYAFGNTLTPEASDAAWEQYAVPAASKVFFEGAGTNLLPKAKLSVDWSDDDRAPLLLVAAEKDHVVPVKVVRHLAAKYKKKSRAVVDLHEFAGRSHFLAGEPGWEEIADDVISWVQQQVGAPTKV